MVYYATLTESKKWMRSELTEIKKEQTPTGAEDLGRSEQHGYTFECDVAAQVLSTRKKRYVIGKEISETYYRGMWSAPHA